ncbi:alpha-1,2-mannosidase, putative [Paraburkholderia fungorum]|uniref:Alpha-1,2-mannosidase, putative n=1 Tax=Paraburkholderia fungorum TaxID=134537 RepID=A0A1H1IPS6_9BURK|nr:alpha-1,2-mannosidase, putative [Paraburkholderia fungorum]
MKTVRAQALCAFVAALLTACGGGTDSHGTGSENSNTASAGAAAPATPPSPASAAQDLPLTQYVDPLIGTLASTSPNPVPAGQAGSVIPAAGLPDGMVQWSPDTNTTPAPSTSQEPGSPAGYYYDLNTIQGFSLMHMSGAGCGGNGGEFPIMPTTDAAQRVPSFSHANEHAAPGYYSVALDNGIKVELTATLRTGFGQFTYPAGQPSILVLDTTRTNTRSSTTGTVSRVSATELSGSTISQGFCNHTTPVTVYFDAVFDQPFASASSIGNGVAQLKFATGATVRMKIGISFVSAANAKLNLTAENDAWDFDATRKAADAAWNQRLNAIQVNGGSHDDKVKFYTALYHTQWSPSVFSDVNGQYIGFDNTTHSVAAGQGAQYTNFSGWDIYRSLIPMKALLFPQQTSDMMQSLINDADQCGAIPRWVNYNVETGVMPGDSGSLMVAGAYAFGARNFDTQSALAHMMTVANVPGTKCQIDTTAEGRGSYLKYHYMTADENGWGPASSTLEYASTDFAMSQFAAALGNTAFQQVELGRSAYWENLLDTASTPPFITARDDSGNWLSAADNSEYVEGNAEQYTWMVPHDVGGLFTKLGGNTVVLKRLDTFFSQLNAGTTLPNFYMGNEPTFTVPWLYNWAGSPSGTQNIVQKIMTTVFSTKPDGLPGNDDLGAVSGWYVWGALGLYPEIPGVGGLTIGSPQFESITVRLGHGKTLQINAPGAPASNYVQSLSVNGTDQPGTWLSLDALANGATMNFTMGRAPSTWGTQTSNAPPSFDAPAGSL